MRFADSVSRSFATDLLADRRFIEDTATLCKTQGDCLLVKSRTKQPELLIIPWKGCFVRYAAMDDKGKFSASGAFFGRSAHYVSAKTDSKIFLKKTY